MLIKVFVNPLRKAQHLNRKQTKENNKKTLQSIRNNEIWENSIEKQNFNILTIKRHQNI